MGRVYYYATLMEVAMNSFTLDNIELEMEKKFTTALAVELFEEVRELEKTLGPYAEGIRELDAAKNALVDAAQVVIQKIKTIIKDRIITGFHDLGLGVGKLVRFTDPSKVTARTVGGKQVWPIMKVKSIAPSYYHGVTNLSLARYVAKLEKAPLFTVDVVLAEVFPGEQSGRGRSYQSCSVVVNLEHVPKGSLGEHLTAVSEQEYEQIRKETSIPDPTVERTKKILRKIASQGAIELLSTEEIQALAARVGVKTNRIK
jgi:hypothetical protein